ncbi:unnamed protein product [Prunus armeniaca]|uniref:Uncharacterized protein n=1 Tax=Prunus armeniaca TaxID=36596 RepID=A0A6J5V4M7_PRUAR|nr:unnamed protein product [Prunus armeniaca]
MAMTEKPRPCRKEMYVALWGVPQFDDVKGPSFCLYPPTLLNCSTSVKLKKILLLQLEHEGYALSWEDLLTGSKNRVILS